MSKSNEGNLRAALVMQSGPNSAADPHLTRAALRRLENAFPGVPLYSNRPLHDAALVEGELFDCLAEVFHRAADQEQDSVALCLDLYPLLDASVVRELLERHFRYLSQYSFAENVPPGIAPDLISLELLPRLLSDRPDDLRAYVMKHINDIDVEIVYRLPDLRQYRMELTTGSPRSRRLAAGVLAHKPDAHYDDLEAVLAADPELLRPFPSYFEIELTTRSRVRPVYLPEPPADHDPKQDLPLATLQSLLADIREHGLYDDATVCFGGLGDPVAYPQFFEAAALVLAEPALRALYVETYATDCDAAFWRQLADLPGAERCRVIVRLPTLRADRYRRLLGHDLLPAVLENLSAYESRAGAEGGLKVYAEMLKIQDVQDEIGDFFDRFESVGRIEPLLGKFNSYAGRVAERRVSDLTPLVRDFCRHLARDVYVRADGSVPLCRQDPYAEGKHRLSLPEATVAEILTAGAPHHAASMRGEHEAIPMPCLQCDEWFTFNA